LFVVLTGPRGLDMPQRMMNHVATFPVCCIGIQRSTQHCPPRPGFEDSRAGRKTPYWLACLRPGKWKGRTLWPRATERWTRCIFVRITTWVAVLDLDAGSGARCIRTGVWFLAGSSLSLSYSSKNIQICKQGCNALMFVKTLRGSIPTYEPASRQCPVYFPCDSFYYLT
jgi:hypothetical protein